MGALLLLRRPEELHGWTNALRGGVEDCTNTTITDDWNMKILAHLPSVFDRHRQQKTPGHPGLKPDWKNTTDAFVAQLKPHIASGKALGVFMGDEKVCGGVPYDDFSIVGAHFCPLSTPSAEKGGLVWLAAARLKAGLPEGWIYSNECSVVQSWPALKCSRGRCTGGVPAGLDAISVDMCSYHRPEPDRAPI